MDTAAFFYKHVLHPNVSTQRPDRSKPPSAHTNISALSQAQPIKPTFKKKRRLGSQLQQLSFTAEEEVVEGAPSFSGSSQTSKNRMPSGPHSQNKSAIISPGNQSSSHNTSTPIITSATDRKHAPTAEQRTTGQQQQRLDSSVRSGSIYSMSGTGSLTAVTTGETPPFEAIPSSFTRRHGRRYLRDPTLAYPLPCDIPELHRQNLRTMLFYQVFNGPFCSPKFKDEPPKKVLDFTCGTGYWSALCHQYYTERGFPPVSFTGFDIAPVAPNMNVEDGMNWNFVQGDFRKVLPFPDNEFDFIMVKESAPAMPLTKIKQHVMEELIRILHPGGTLEICDVDYAVRMLLPHTPAANPASDDDSYETEIHKVAHSTSAYIVTAQTPFATPQNQYLMDYNNWLTKIFDQIKRCALPGTLIRSDLLQETETLTDLGFRRYAVPLSEVRWEREGVGGYVKLGADGQARISAKGKAKEGNKKVLTAGQAALRRTALQTVVQTIESLEPLLKEASGKGQDEWDRWWGNMMNDLMKSNGTSWGECLEIGAWWATKRE